LGLGTIETTLLSVQRRIMKHAFLTAALLSIIT
jgi:hypothetical protein